MSIFLYNTNGFDTEPIIIIIFQTKIKLQKHDLLHCDHSLFLYNLPIFDIDNQ